MFDHCCYVVPPYLLRSISESENNPEPIRKAAEATLNRRIKISNSLHNRSKVLAENAGIRKSSRSLSKPSIVPIDLLRHIANSEDVDERVRKCARRDLAHLKGIHEKALAGKDGTATSSRKMAAVAEDESKKEHTFYWAVYDAKNSFAEFQLPGELIRAEGQPAAKDKAVNDAYDNVGQVLSAYKQLFNWNSVDNDNMHIISTVHFGENYENAYWDPDRMQIVFGDGDEFLSNFTGCVDVIGHELTHAVTENTTPLLYFGQSGALNEHVSDVFGIMVKQFVEKTDVEAADWLIGEGCIAPGVKGIALRSMKAPGTAYNDPRFCNFLEFANATINSAKTAFSEDVAKIVENAWKEVGVIEGGDGGDGNEGGDKKDDDKSDGGWLDWISDLCKPF
ncbi:Thermolysin [Scedosporium apiospermum]|uniref:Thermolysin n=1 Tax=Pseudallescheria apiosperma TaxID=563466 RepID=A0A084FWR0_PSEDA|nr:Thermolysin [Scedosporium apiospermum]KEZ39522.1 Thermolysin [Scedosporium apiospermum]